MDAERNSEVLLRQLLTYEKKQLRHTRLATFVNILLVLAVLAALVLLVPRALHSLAEVDRLAVSAQTFRSSSPTLPCRSSSGIKSAGEIIPSSGWHQRTSASALTIFGGSKRISY